MKRLQSERLKEVLGGKDLNAMTLSEREKVLCNLYMKNVKVMEDALCINIDDVLNYKKNKKRKQKA
jgi:hypothetical protein